MTDGLLGLFTFSSSSSVTLLSSASTFLRAEGMRRTSLKTRCSETEAGVSSVGLWSSSWSRERWSQHIP